MEVLLPGRGRCLVLWTSAETFSSFTQNHRSEPSGRVGLRRCHTRRVTTAAEPRVTLLGRPGCHLCENARAVIQQVTAELGESFVELDITTDADLHDRYWEQIPVTLVDGKQHDFFWVDADRLRSALTR